MFIDLLIEKSRQIGPGDTYETYTSEYWSKSDSLQRDLKQIDNEDDIDERKEEWITGL